MTTKPTQQSTAVLDARILALSHQIRALQDELAQTVIEHAKATETGLYLAWVVYQRSDASYEVVTIPDMFARLTTVKPIPTPMVIKPVVVTPRMVDPVRTLTSDYVLESVLEGVKL